jgi:hypothetical protein
MEEINMTQKVQLQLNDQLVRNLTNGFAGWDEKNTYQTELCSFKTSEGKGKDFYHIAPDNGGQALIVKVFPEVDGSMGMTNDRQMRELAFVESELYPEFATIVDLPKMAVSRTKDGLGMLAMEDVSEALAKIGPGAPLTPELVRNLIMTIGQLHSRYWQKPAKWDWLMDFSLWVKRGAQMLLVLAEGGEQPEWARNILRDKPGLARGIQPFLNSLSASTKEQFFSALRQPERILAKLADTPQTIGHGDLFFTNLGERDGRILLIDWEFVGVMPAPWDISCSYAGMPPVGVSEEEMLELYFAQISAATAAEREAWLQGYRMMGAIEGMIYGLRTLVPAIFDPESRVPEPVKANIRGEVDQMVEEIIRVSQ